MEAFVFGKFITLLLTAAALLPMAVHADDVLAGCRKVESLSAAVGDCGLVVGTTCRKDIV